METLKDSPFATRCLTNTQFKGLVLYRPGGNFVLKRDKSLSSYLNRNTLFPVHNNKTPLGLPLPKRLCKELKIKNPENTIWQMGYHNFESFDFLIFSQGIKAVGTSKIWSKRDRFKVGPVFICTSDASEGIEFNADTIYFWPHFIHTKMKKRGNRQQFYLDVPDIFLDVLRGDKFYNIEKKKIIYPELREIPFTLLYDKKGNLIYFKHKYSKEYKNDIIPFIPGCKYKIPS